MAAENQFHTMRILIAAHTGQRRWLVTLSIILEHFLWRSMVAEVEYFVRYFLHFLYT